MVIVKSTLWRELGFWYRVWKLQSHDARRLAISFYMRERRYIRNANGGLAAEAAYLKQQRKTLHEARLWARDVGLTRALESE